MQARAEKRRALSPRKTGKSGVDIRIMTKSLNPLNSPCNFRIIWYKYK